MQTRHHSRCSVYGMISDLISVSIFPDPSSPDPSWQKAEQKMVKIKSFVIFQLYVRSDSGKGYERCFISYFELMVSFLWLLRTRTNHIFRQVCPRFTRKCQFWNWLNPDNKKRLFAKSYTYISLFEDFYYALILYQFILSIIRTLLI